MYVRMLGPLLMEFEGDALPLGRPKQRTVYATLLMHAGRLVTVDTLVDELWEGDPPRSAVANIRTYAANLRRLFHAHPGSGVLLESRGPGYVLSLRSDHFDLHLFKEQVRGAQEAIRHADHEAAVVYLETGLSLWRGDPFEDVPHGPSLASWCLDLQQDRAGAVEDWVRAGLDLDRPATVLPQIREHVRAHPLRERGWELLVEALYRSSDVAGALVGYGRARAALTQELGIEPGPRLRELHLSVLKARR